MHQKECPMNNFNKLKRSRSRKMFEDFDPTGRKPNSQGGINRTSFAIGAFSKATILIQRLKNTLKAHKR